MVSGEERHFVDRKWISWSLGISVLGNFSRMKENCREGNLEEKRETVGSEDIDLFGSRGRFLGVGVGEER